MITPLVLPDRGGPSSSTARSGPREPPLPILARTEPHGTASTGGERADRLQRVPAGGNRGRPWGLGPGAGGDDRVDHAEREEH